MRVRCPRCGGDSLYSADNPYRPFCSATCKNIDFGAWASESYRVEAAPDPNDPDAPMDIGGPRANRANAAKTRELTWANQYLAADPEQREAMKKHAESVINGPEGVIESTGKALQRGGESLMHWADSTIPLTDEEKSRFSVQSVQLAARMVPIVAAAIASGSGSALGFFTSATIANAGSLSS